MKTLKTCVLKTATVTSVKLITPADRIGQGLGVATYPTDNLSPGQFPMPHNPEPEEVRSRETLSAMQLQMQLRAGSDAVPPASSAGCPSAPGLSADRFESFGASRITGWRRTTRTAVNSRTRRGCRFADPSRTHVPGDLSHTNRLGRDCQSPDRLGDKRITKREVSSASVAGK